ncbi:hypothetical protein BDR22DRAFT_823678 [Usnea florida]
MNPTSATQRDQPPPSNSLARQPTPSTSTPEPSHPQPKKSSLLSRLLASFLVDILVEILLQRRLLSRPDGSVVYETPMWWLVDKLTLSTMPAAVVSVVERVVFWVLVVWVLVAWAEARWAMGWDVEE